MARETATTGGASTLDEHESGDTRRVPTAGRSAAVAAIALVVFALGAGPLAQAGELLSGFSVLAGYSTAHLRDQDDYQRIPVTFRFSLDPGVLFGREDIDLPGDWSLNLEPFFTQVVEPATRQEIGLGIFIRCSQMLGDSPFRVFAEAGSGPIYMTLETEEQSTKGNFLSAAGVGVAYVLAESVEIEVGYRYWHLSNASLGHDNSGIDGSMVQAGLVCRY